MKELLVEVTETVVIVIDAMALIVILIGTVAAFCAALKGIFTPLESDLRRSIWLRYARWLVAGLTFQLAADIVESSIATSWESVGRLAAIAVIRTFLNYFLERDVAEVRELQKKNAAEPTTVKP